MVSGAFHGFLRVPRGVQRDFWGRSMVLLHEVSGCPKSAPGALSRFLKCLIVIQRVSGSPRGALWMFSVSFKTVPSVFQKVSESFIGIPWAFMGFQQHLVIFEEFQERCGGFPERLRECYGRFMEF